MSIRRDLILIGCAAAVVVGVVAGTVVWADVVHDRAVSSHTNEISEESVPLMKSAHATLASALDIAVLDIESAERSRPQLEQTIVDLDNLYDAVSKISDVPGVVAEDEAVRRAMEQLDNASASLSVLIETTDSASRAELASSLVESIRLAFESLESASFISLSEFDEEVHEAELRQRNGRWIAILVAAAGFIIVAILMRRFARRITAPLKSIRTASLMVAEGRDITHVSEEGPSELVDVVASFNTMTDVVSERERMLTQLAYRDTTTGLENRVALCDQIRALRLTRPVDRSFEVSILALTLEGLDEVIAGHGYDVGDNYMTIVVERIRSIQTTSDLLFGLRNDTLALLTVQPPEGATALGDSLIASIAMPLRAHGSVFHPRVSIGVATTTTPSQISDSLIVDAEVAKLAGRVEGQSSILVFDQSLRERSTDRLRLTEELENAIDVDEFVVHYQPIVDVRDGRLLGAEALVRWQHPVKGLLQPVDFLETAEQGGHICRLGLQIMEEAFRDAARWREMADDFIITVNVSPRQLGTGTFVDDVASALQRTGLPPTALCLEITEAAAFNPSTNLTRDLTTLRLRGIGVALDDFGTGFSSLHLINTLRVDYIKIDQSFVLGVSHRPELRAMVSSIMRIADAYGCETIAEGVETEQDASLLTTLGATFAQGYLYGRAVSASDFELRWMMDLESATTGTD